MTKKRFRKLLRAHFTKYYLEHKDTLDNNWISNAYKASRNSKTNYNYNDCFEAIKRVLS